jgi:uncharacterized protein YlxP (DUF503 family)
MHVATLTLQLYLPSRTLKEKRSIVKSILARARNRFNVATSEVDLHDSHDNAVIAFVTVAAEAPIARRLLQGVEEWLVAERPDLEVVAADIDEW